MRVFSLIEYAALHLAASDYIWLQTLYSRSIAFQLVDRYGQLSAGLADGLEQVDGVFVE